MALNHGDVGSSPTGGTKKFVMQDTTFTQDEDEYFSVSKLAMLGMLVSVSSEYIEIRYDIEQQERRRLRNEIKKLLK